MSGLPSVAPNLRRLATITSMAVLHSWVPSRGRGRSESLEKVKRLTRYDQRSAFPMAEREAAQPSPPIAVPRYGEPVLIWPRLGQGAFRVSVTQVYDRRCAVTRERTLPILEAAHIRPFAEGGPHEVTNGLLLIG